MERENRGQISKTQQIQSNVENFEEGEYIKQWVSYYCFDSPGFSLTEFFFLASWDSVDENLIKKQLGSKVNQGFNLNEFPALGSSDVNLRQTLETSTSLGGSQTIPPPGLQPQLQHHLQSTQTPITNSNNIINELKLKPKPKSEEELTDMDRYGLNGLLGLLRAENPDQNTVAIGSDLNILGLDMSEKSVDVKLSKTFPSPWIETSRSEVEPQFTVPEYFKVDSLSKVEDKLTLFTDETLFYIFYTRTKDVLQELSARELMNRNWRYHKELQVWLTKDSNTEPIQQSPQSERGLYIFFDPHNWEKVRKEFILYYQAIMST